MSVLREGIAQPAGKSGGGALPTAQLARDTASAARAGLASSPASSSSAAAVRKQIVISSARAHENPPRKMDVRHLGGEVFCVQEDLSDKSALWGELFKESERKFLRKMMRHHLAVLTVGATFRVFIRSVLHPEPEHNLGFGMNKTVKRIVPAVTLLHAYEGGLTSSWTWGKLLMTIFQYGISAVVLDFPGFGRSCVNGEAMYPLEAWKHKDWRMVIDSMDAILLQQTHVVAWGESASAFIRILQNSPHSLEREHVLFNPIIDFGEVFKEKLSAEPLNPSPDWWKERTEEFRRLFCADLRAADLRVWVLFDGDDAASDERLQRSRKAFEDCMSDHILVHRVFVQEISKSDICEAQIGTQVPFRFLFIRRELKECLAKYLAHKAWPPKYDASLPEAQASTDRSSIVPPSHTSFTQLPRSSLRAPPTEPQGNQGGSSSLPELRLSVPDTGVTASAAGAARSSFISPRARSSIDALGVTSSNFRGSTSSLQLARFSGSQHGQEDSLPPQIQRAAVDTARSSILGSQAMSQTSSGFFSRGPTAPLCAKAVRAGGIMRDYQEDRERILTMPIMPRLAKARASHANSGVPILEAAVKSWPDLREMIRSRSVERVEDFLHPLLMAQDGCSPIFKRALRLAVEEGDPNIPMPGNTGERPLHEAVRCRSVGGMYHLLRAKASLEAIDAHLHTPLDVAFEDPQTAQALRLVLQEDSDNSRTNLFDAREAEHKDRQKDAAREREKLRRSKSRSVLRPSQISQGSRRTTITAHTESRPATGISRATEQHWLPPQALPQQARGSQASTQSGWRPTQRGTSQATTHRGTIQSTT